MANCISNSTSSYVILGIKATAFFLLSSTSFAYARITDDKISKDMDKLMERRKKQSTGEKTNKSN